MCESTCRALPPDAECPRCLKASQSVESWKGGKVFEIKQFPLLPNSINIVGKLITMFLPGNLIKISGPRCYIKINARPCCKELHVAVSDLCRITQRRCRNLNSEAPYSWARTFSLVYSLSLNLKKRRKAVQNHHFPLEFIEMSFEWDQTMLYVPLGNWHGQKSVRTGKLQLWSS